MLGILYAKNGGLHPDENNRTHTNCMAIIFWEDDLTEYSGRKLMLGGCSF